MIRCLASFPQFFKKEPLQSTDDKKGFSWENPNLELSYFVCDCGQGSREFEQGPSQTMQGLR